MSVDDLLYSPIVSKLYHIWFVPQPYHDANLRAISEFITVYTPKPVSLAEAKQIILDLEIEGFDIRPLEIRPVT